MNDNEKYIEEFVKDIPFDAPDQKHRDELKNQLLNTFPKHRLQPAAHTVPVWTKITKSSTTRVAAAAVILIGVLVLTSVFVKTNKGVALAGVLEKVEQARAFMYKMEMTMTTMLTKSAGKHQTRGTAVISKEYGMKAQVEVSDSYTGETTIQQMYLLFDQKLMLTLIPEKKKYMRMELDDNLLASKKKENNDPREMLKQILACKYTELGRSEINGIEVEGFKTTDPEFAAGVVDEIEVTLWVDVKTWLPVLWEMDIKNKMVEIHAVISDYQWDIPVVESDFKPVIPADYTSMTDDGYERPGRTGTEEADQEHVIIVGRKEPSATEHCERGEDHYFNGEYEQAFSELTKAIEIDPELARAYVIRGMAYNDKGKYDLAIADFTKAIGIGPGLARAYVTRGMAYEDKDEHDLAIADFTKVIEIKPTDAHAYLYRGMAYQNKGEYDLAIADYSKAIEMDPKIADSYKGRARAYYYKGEYDKAWKDVHEAQALGQKFDSKLLEKLRKASGIDK